MRTYCECGALHKGQAAQARCQECGTVCCRSCAMEIETTTYCRWCATHLTPAVA